MNIRCFGADHSRECCPQETTHTTNYVYVCLSEISASTQHSRTHMLEGEMSDSCGMYACVGMCMCGVNRTIFHSQRLLTVPPGLSVCIKVIQWHQWISVSFHDFCVFCLYYEITLKIDFLLYLVLLSTDTDEERFMATKRLKNIQTIQHTQRHEILIANSRLFTYTADRATVSSHSSHLKNV